MSERIEEYGIRMRVDVIKKTPKRWFETGTHRETISLFLSHWDYFLGCPPAERMFRRLAASHGFEPVKA